MGRQGENIGSNLEDPCETSIHSTRMGKSLKGIDKGNVLQELTLF